MWCLMYVSRFLCLNMLVGRMNWTNGVATMTAACFYRKRPAKNMLSLWIIILEEMLERVTSLNNNRTTILVEALLTSGV